MEMIFSLEEIDAVAKTVVEHLSQKVVLFHADMGAGKTTLIKHISKQLGIDDMTSSPTFSIVNEYRATNGTQVFHFDLYRLNSEEEAYDFGIEEYLYSGEWCFIEWPEKTPNLIPNEHQQINLTVLQNGKRKLTLF
ncbi:MAG: tRNA (adenosine(37)-N6)-threonylcarbamoyltransferase complex ATPase subunit type 1 TsaE [Flavobacterium sp.]|nr:tRNA (adenosine(37)-N6)-threonylcarbamoyltransferase complex ATPase subunit type 1 TsaE [Candidatus Neoflavobacterium equi]